MAVLLIALVVVFNCHDLHFVAGQQILMQSPCPEVFRYDLSMDWSTVKGVITVASSLPILLKVTIAVPAILTKTYDGKLEVADDRAEIVRLAKSGRLKEVRYNLIFSRSAPLPRLVSIEVNSKVICSAPPFRRRIETTVTLEHRLSLAEEGKTSYKPKDSRKDLAKFSGGWSYPKNILPARENCGVRLKAGPLIVGGASLAKGEWPWLVPLFKKTELGLQFLCSSTLVSTRFIVTVAHCLKLEGEGSVAGSGLVAYAGRYSLKNWAESHSQPREISEVFIHPDYDQFSLHSDLAVLKLEEPVSVSPYVIPACIWSGSADVNDVVGKTGTVSGWGMDGGNDKIADTPRAIDMPIVSQEECLRSKIEFLYLTSNRTLCAGYRNGTGPCNGDSGGGLLMPQEDSDGNVRWYLRGVVSLSVKHKQLNKCDLSEYVVFTDVAKYQTWLSNILTMNDIDVSDLARIART